MQVFHRLAEVTPLLAKSAVAIGNFDGVHLGHRALLGRMVEIAKRDGATPVVLTFFPHPVEVLNPAKKLERLTTASEKLMQLESVGVELVLVEKFDLALASLEARDFFLRYLADGLKATSVHVGFNFNFGKDRRGNTELLASLCAGKKIELHVEQPFEKDGMKVDSSTIRKIVREGDMGEAAKLLGRPYSILGQVMHGDHRGTQLGFPTANLHFPNEKVLPRNGVYVTRTHWQRQVFKSVTNVGVRPTVGDGQLAARVEVHLLDFNARLYDEFLQVEFLERLRDEKKFESLEALKIQIRADAESARNSRAFL